MKCRDQSWVIGTRYSWVRYGKLYFNCTVPTWRWVLVTIRKPMVRRRLLITHWNNIYVALQVNNPKNGWNGYLGLSTVTTLQCILPPKYPHSRPFIVSLLHLCSVMFREPLESKLSMTSSVVELSCYRICASIWMLSGIGWKFRRIKIVGKWSLMSGLRLVEASTIPSKFNRLSAFSQVIPSLFFALSSVS